MPYGYYPADSAEGRRLLQEFHLDATRLPAFILHDARVFVQPAWTEVAAAMGARTCPACQEADVTIIPGVFAVGDVRQRSMKRVASAVGEGATAISLIHEDLQEQEHRHA